MTDPSPRSGSTTAALFASTLFVAAALLFVVQPMAARAVLPRFGGSAAVWTTCALVFQVELLAGYAYAHALSTWLGPRRQVGLHLVVVLAVVALHLGGRPTAVTVGGPTPVDHPTFRLIGLIARSVGLPFFVLATTAPLLQRWYATTGGPSSGDPYFLYASSNAGSLAALAAYPAWVERHWHLGEQLARWGQGLALLPALVAACGLVTVRREPVGPEVLPGVDAGPPVGPGRWLGWAVLALIPSSLLLGVTTYLTTDLAAIPLLWVLPLGLYLSSFVVTFSRLGGASRRAAGRALPWLVMAQAPVMGAGLVQPFWIPLHVLTFFTAAVLCHGELAARRPPASRLTSFYLATAVGGALGGLFNALVAPAVFNRVAEYPLALVAACLVLGVRAGSPAESAMAEGTRTKGRHRLSSTLALGSRSVGHPGLNREERPGLRVLTMPLIIGSIAAALCANVGGVADSAAGVVATMTAAGLSVLVAVNHRRRPVAFALTVGALLAAGGLASGVTGRVIHRERSFFGVLTVTEVDGGRFHRLFHGSTLHGQQAMDPDRRREPLTYFTPSGPIGQVFAAFNARPGRGPARVAVTGVGAGSLASYARPGQRWTFYEIDPAVVRVARDRRYFTYLADSPASPVGVVLGDARLTLAREPDGSFGLIVLDAFSSDAIPAHLLTREALALDLRKLAPGGLIAVNVSNRYLDLAPVVALLALDAGLAARVRVDADLTPSEKAAGKQGSIWAALARRESDLGGLARDPRWFTPRPRPGDTVWTDDFSNLVDHLRFRSRFSQPRRAVRAVVDQAGVEGLRSRPQISQPRRGDRQ